MYKKIISIVVLIILATGCSNNIQPTAHVSFAQTDNIDTDNYIELYKPVINAYIMLEQSGYNLADENILSDDFCLNWNGGGSYFIGNDSKPTLMYAFYDLNKNDTPNLLIGVEIESDEDSESNVFITGIYSLQEGKPVSLIQVGAWSQLNLFLDINDSGIIKKTFGTHIDFVEEHFYKIDDDETLLTLVKIYTYGIINNYDNPDDIKYRYSVDVNGEEVGITEQEYLELMRGYGCAGYLDTTGDLEANEIIINSWESLASYK